MPSALLTPIYHMPTIEAKQAAMRELYALGQTWEGFATIEEVIAYQIGYEWMPAFPYLIRSPDSTDYRLEDDGGVAYLMEQSLGTHVNSVPHAIEYLRRGGITARTYRTYDGDIIERVMEDEEIAIAEEAAIDAGIAARAEIRRLEAVAESSVMIDDPAPRGFLHIDTETTPLNPRTTSAYWSDLGIDPTS